uniref:Uncharacterized protein n=2 Tax=Oryza TaxID=4527 RepID=A0A0D3EPM9_9ORYZ
MAKRGIFEVVVAEEKLIYVHRGDVVFFSN